MKKREKHSPKNGSRLTSLAYGFLLVMLCFITYANSLGGEFVWDDQLQLFRNTRIRTIESIPHAFTSSLWSFMYSQDPAMNNSSFDMYYRPMQEVVYTLVYQVAALSPFAYHFTNLILHSAATVLIYLLCLELGLSSFIGLLAGSLFAVHPVHTEAVSWIAGVGDLICGTFYFAALAAFLRFLKSGSVKWHWASSICFLTALFSKEMAATFPIVVLLILLVREEPRWSLKSVVLVMWPYVLVTGIYAGLRLVAVGLNAGPALNVSVVDWTTLVVWAVGNYFRYVIVPYPLYIYHVVPTHLGDRVFSTLFYAAIVIGAAVVLWLSRRRFPNQALWCSIFFFTLLPVLYFKAISVFFAERYLYIPSMAIVVGAGFCLAQLNRTHALLITSIVVGIFSVITIQRNRDWQSEEKLFSRTLQFQPEAVNIQTSLAESYLRKGDNPQAQKHFEEARERFKDERFIQSPYENYRIYHGLGLAAARQARPAEAVVDLEKAIELYPAGDAAYTTLGGVLVNLGQDYPRAMSVLEKAIQLNPTNDLARDYMGVALVNQGQIDRAIPYFREALKINPDLESAKQHLGVALQRESH